jgi:hypothetical protein
MVGKMVFGEKILEKQKAKNSQVIMLAEHPLRFLWDLMVGLGGLEPPTSPLSE